MESTSKQVIYDIGCNNGDDLPYYLQKADKVVAVDAVPSLCDTIKKTYAAEIESGHLVVENCVFLADDHDQTEGTVDFYIHKEKHVLSQFPKPDADLIDNYEKVAVPGMTMSALFARHGNPHYLKIDVEHYDEQILKSVFFAGVLPPYLSAEVHSSRVADLLFQRPEYTGFKLVVGSRVDEEYNNTTISTNTGSRTFSFPNHSAGPFGNDIHGPWLDRRSLKHLIVKEGGYGWKDIHATRLHQGERVTSPTLLKDYARLYKGAVTPYLPEFAKSIYRSIKT